MNADTAPLIRDLGLADVRLAETSPFARAREQMLHLARVYPIDRLLAVFRANAGLDTRGALAPGTWENFGHPNEQAWGEHDYPGREQAQTANLLRGHYAGHFLSMLSIAAAGEADPLLRGRVDELVAGLAEVQRTLAATGRYSHPGFLAAYGEWQFARLEDYAPYGEIWAPYYTCHKIMAGLLDAYELTGNATALEVVTAMGHWVHARLSRLDDARRQRMWSLYIAGEFGGMNETMARLSIAANVPVFLDTARLFDQHDLVEAGSSGRDILDGMHANQHLPQLIGYVREYELTGHKSYLDAATGIWDQVVPGRMYAHGGTGESELWGPAGTVAGDIGHRNAETCATYNLLKLARLLFQHTLDPQYMDYYERAVHNHILGSRRDVCSDTSPEVTYMFPVHPGALPEYDNTGTCCGGTGLENHVKYQDTVFFQGAGSEAELWINFYTPAELTWREQDLRVTLDTDLPYAGAVRIRVEPLDGRTEPVRLALHLRIPDWVSGPVSAHVDETVVALDGLPGSYATVTRDWVAGECLAIDLPMALRTSGTIDDPHLQHLSLGPSVLAARSDSTTLLKVPLGRRRMLGGVIQADERDPGAALRAHGAVMVDGLRFEPVWNGSSSRYHLYVRPDDATIGFAGVDSGVPARRRPDGTTILDDIWVEPTPHTPAAFLTRVLATVQSARAEGLLGGEEARTVARTALDSDLAASAAAASGQGVGNPDEGARAAVRAWLHEIADDQAPSAPAVEILVTAEQSSTGWYTSRPRVEVRTTTWLTDASAPLVEVSIDEEEWRPYTGAFVIETEGEVLVAARATAAGLTGSAARTLHVDTTPPVSEAVVKSLGSSVEITFTARDDVSGTERIQWQGEDTFWATFQEAFVRALGDTEQVIEYAATDRAGNEEQRRRLILPARDR